MPPNAPNACLPPPAAADVLHRPAVAPPRTVLLPKPDAAAAADARAMQLALHHLARREQPASHATTILSAAHEYGVAATLHSLVLPLLDSLASNTTLFAPKLMLWSDQDGCPRKDLSCFFASLPSMDATIIKAPTIGTRSALSTTQWRRFADAWFGPSSAHALPTDLRVRGKPSLTALTAAMRPRLQASRHRAATVCRRARASCPRVLPAHFAATANVDSVFKHLPTRWSRHGHFWLVANALHFLARPNAELKFELERARAALGLRAERQPVLALHVRKGDACSHRGECRGLAAFMPQVRRVAARYGIRTIFLATPSAEVQAETLAYPEFKWLFRNASSAASLALQSSRHIRIEDGLLSGQVNATTEWRSTMIDVYLMAECAAFIGAFSSSAARLALALMAGGSAGCLKPFASTDIDWCFAFLRGGANVIHRGPPEPPPRGSGELEDEAAHVRAARKAEQSGMTC